MARYFNIDDCFEMDLWNACMHVGVIVNVGFVRRNGGRRGWTRLSERRRQEVEVEDENDDVNEDDEYKERDDVDVGFDDFVTNGSGKEVEDEINDVVGTIVTMNDNASTLSTLTVPEFKERLREARLPVSGKKSELIARLVRL